jgi:gamma-glutamyltranspeptidase
MALGFIEFGMLPADAIDAPRIHTDGSGPVTVDARLPKDVVSFLESRGHKLQPTELPIGNPASAIMIDSESGDLLAASQRGEEAVGIL